jgi:hypothetical protein
MKNIFVFFHVGADISLPTMLAKSISETNPESLIIQCSDKHTPKIEQATEIEIFEGDPSNLMTYRISAFSKLKIDQPAIYLDTDMLVMKKLDIKNILGTYDVKLCQREFDTKNLHSGTQRGIYFPEHLGIPIGKVYPYVACATISKNYVFWEELESIIQKLDQRFHKWYGDQEAMRIWIDKQSTLCYSFLSESKYACLPERINQLKDVNILHFKGGVRKKLMLDLFNNIFLKIK